MNAGGGNGAPLMLSGQRSDKRTLIGGSDIGNKKIEAIREIVLNFRKSP